MLAQAIGLVIILCYSSTMFTSHKVFHLLLPELLRGQVLDFGRREGEGEKTIGMQSTAKGERRRRLRGAAVLSTKVCWRKSGRWRGGEGELSYNHRWPQ